MEKTLQDLTRQLLVLSKSAAEEKVLPQEMQLIQEKAFKVQEEMMQLLQQQEETYFNKYGFIMDGKTKRYTRKSIEKNFNKGKYDKYLTNNHTSLNG